MKTKEVLRVLKWGSSQSKSAMKEERSADLRVSADFGGLSRVENVMLSGALGLIEVRRTEGLRKEGPEEKLVGRDGGLAGGWEDLDGRCGGGVERRCLRRGGGDIGLDADLDVDIARLVKVVICSLLTSLLRLRRARRSASIAFRSSPRMLLREAEGGSSLSFFVLVVPEDNWRSPTPAG